MSPENDRAIRTGNERWTGVTPFDPLDGLVLDWRESKKGNPFCRAQAFGHVVVVSVYPSRFHEGEWIYSICVNDGAWQNSPDRMASQEEAKEIAIGALRIMLRSLRRGQDDDEPQPTLTEQPKSQDRPTTDPPPARRIRL